MAAGQYRPIRPFSAEIYERGTRRLPLKATQTFKVGAPLVWNGAYLEEAGAGPATISYIAAEDATSNAADGGADCIVFPVMASDLWEASFEDAWALVQRGDVFGIVKDATTGYWYVDTGDANDQALVIDVIQTPELGAVGDTKGRMIIKFQYGNIANY